MSISSELSNSLLILIEGNQNGCAVVAYRSAFTWLAIMSSTPPPPTHFLALSGLLQLGLKRKKK